MEFNNEKTSIEYFNDYTRDFVRDVQSTFPEYKDLLGEYYSDILTEESQNTDKHVKRFMRKMRETICNPYENALYNTDIMDMNPVIRGMDVNPVIRI